MHHFDYRDGVLHGEGVSLEALAATVGTPCYVYSRATLVRHWQVMDAALAAVDHTICYSVKANSNLAVLQLLASLGSGFDIVSRGELERVIAAGGDPSRVVFSGVGKGDAEIEAALIAGIRCVNVESGDELAVIEGVARSLDLRAPIAIRVNPDVDARTHAYIATGLKTSKFGVDVDRAMALYRVAAASPHLEVVGVDTHIGSQLTDVEPLVEALDCVLALVDRLAAEGITLRHVDMGGGLGIPYRDEITAPPRAYGEALCSRLSARGLSLIVEPGRVIAGNAGLLLMRVLATKENGEKRFVIVDAGMNDNMRPTLYGAWQRIMPVRDPGDAPLAAVDVVGPVCETGDFFAKDRDLPPARRGDLLAMMSAGAYGFAMASTYNSRVRPAEVLVHGDAWAMIRERESVSDLWRGEHLIDASWLAPGAADDPDDHGGHGGHGGGTRQR